MPSVVFVCTGNMCRSPTAEGILKDRLSRIGRSDFSVGSMGIHAKEGQMASADSLAACREQTIDISGHISRPLDYEELNRSDFIFVMEAYQKQYVQMFVPDASERVFLLGAWPAIERSRGEIPDPLGKGVGEYRRNFKSIAHHIDRILPYLLAETMRGGLDITPCLLDTENPLIVDGATLGSRIAATGREHLWEPRLRPGEVNVIVIHSVCAGALVPADPFDRRWILKIFCDYGVSSHYLIERSGEILRLVPEGMKAWHAGGSIMPEPDNRQAVNEFSLGIELAASSASGFTAAQYGQLVQLCVDIERRYVRNFIFVGHEDIAGRRAVSAGLRKDIKTDPGPAFGWQEFLGRLEDGRASRG